MASPETLNALKILAGGPGRQVLPQEEYGFSGAVPTQGELSSPYEREQTARAGAADAADRVRQEHQQQLYDYQQPNETAVRQDQEAMALRKLIMPAQVKGQYDVEAAKQAQVAQGQRDDRLYNNRTNLQAGQNSAVDARAVASQKSQALRQQYTAKTNELKKAGGRSPGNLFGMMETPQQKVQKEIDALTAQMASEGQGDSSEAPVDAGGAPAAGPGGPRQTRRLKNGGVAYSDDGGATWYQE